MSLVYCLVAKRVRGISHAAEFSRNSVRLVKRCSKPDGKEFQKVNP